MDYTFDEIKSIGQKRGYVLSSKIFLSPPGNVLTYIIANFIGWSPNFVTFLSLFFGLSSAYCFFNGALIAGSILFYVCYIFDYTDGCLARLTKKTSVIGKFLDYITDTIVPIAVGYALCFYFKYNLTTVLLILGYIIITLVIQNLYEFSYKINGNQLLMTKVVEKSQKSAGNTKKSVFLRVREWLLSKNIRPSISQCDTNMLIFIVGPLFHLITAFTIVGLVLMSILLVTFLIVQIKVSTKKVV